MESRSFPFSFDIAGRYQQAEKKEREDKDRATQHRKPRITTLDNTIFLPKKHF